MGGCAPSNRKATPFVSGCIACSIAAPTRVQSPIILTGGGGLLFAMRDFGTEGPSAIHRPLPDPHPCFSEKGDARSLSEDVGLR